MKNAAFTLIEVLVALVIMSIAMTSLMMALSELSQHQTYLKQKPLALITAKNILLKTQLGLLPLSTTEGNDKQLEHAFHWKMSHFDTAFPGIQRIVVTVSEHDRAVQSLEGFKKVKRV